MEASAMDLVNLVFRWLHVIAGVMWIGHLWFFNFVNSQLAKTYDPDSKQKVLPELMPRALYWFRWGAAYTLITGILLLGVVYYMGGVLWADATNNPGAHIGMAVGLGSLIVGWVIYDNLWKATAESQTVGTLISIVLITAASFGLTQYGFSGRAVFIHAGAIFGMCMAANVWMRIWPAQRKIIAAVKAGDKPEGAWGAIAGLRSKHNTYMSMPLLLLMISNHYPTVYGGNTGWVAVAVIVVLGFGMTKLMYNKAATPAPAQY
jgi:uncharacterized membrane protein